MNPDTDMLDYLLGEADPETIDRVERQITTDPAFASELRRLAPLVEQMGRLPAAAWESLPYQPNPERVRVRSRLRQLAAGFAAVAATIIVAVVLVLTLGGNSPGKVVILHPLPGGPPEASGTARLASDQTVVLAVSRLPQSRRGYYYEAWLMTSETRLVPLVSFSVPASGDTTITLRLPAAAQDYRYIDISVQRRGAALVHSQHSVLRGTTTS